MGSEEPLWSLLMAADTVKWHINPKPSCVKRGTRHVGGQLGRTEEEESFTHTQSFDSVWVDQMG